MPDNLTTASGNTPPRPLGPQAPPGRSILEAVYDFFSSVLLALFLLIALAATSIFGTIILQRGGRDQYIGEYGEALTSFFRLLGLDDMYYSWWFLTLLTMLLLNITLCSIKRFPRAWWQMTLPAEPLGDDLFRRLKYRASLRYPGGMDSALEVAGKAVTSHFGKPQRLEDERSITLVAERGWYGRLGVYVTHLSILILALGVLYGGMNGFRGDVNILEGQTVDVIPKRGNPRIGIRLPFLVRCDKFMVEYYKNGQPKSFISDLTVIDGGKEAMKRRIKVNDPLRYGEWSFFQATYGPDPASTVTLEVLDRAGRVTAPDVTVKAGESFTVPNDSTQYVVGALNPNAPMLGGAMVELRGYLGSEPLDFAVFEKNPGYDRNRGGPVFFRVKSTSIRQYTGIEVCKDPGVPVIWLACFVMMAGLYITFFVAHQRVWVRVEKDPATPAVLAAGTTSRNPVVFERDFEGLVAEMKKSLKER